MDQGGEEIGRPLRLRACFERHVNWPPHAAEEFHQRVRFGRHDRTRQHPTGVARIVLTVVA